MRKPLTKPAKIDEILGRTATRLRIADQMRRYKLWERWSGIVGERIAAHARPWRWQGRTLVIRVAHSAWVQELTFLTEQMLQQIRAALPKAKIDQLRYEVGELPALPAQATPFAAAPRPITDDEREFIEQAAGEIADPEIREAARKAMCRGFAAKTRDS
jgi:predicted nucleic acid-binding Zn ribbon protein